MINVFMVNVLNIQTIQKLQPFVNVNQGWSGQYCTIPHTCTCVHLIHYVLVFQLIIDRYVFVL